MVQPLGQPAINNPEKNEEHVMKNQYNKTVVGRNGRFLNQKIGLWIGVVVLLLVVSLVAAGGGTSEPRYLTAAGGSQVSVDNLTFSSALGQPVAGSVGAGNIITASGFWVGAGVQVPPPGGHFLFLPVVSR